MKEQNCCSQARLLQMDTPLVCIDDLESVTRVLFSSTITTNGCIVSMQWLYRIKVASWREIFSHVLEQRLEVWNGEDEGWSNTVSFFGIFCHSSGYLPPQRWYFRVSNLCISTRCLVCLRHCLMMCIKLTSVSIRWVPNSEYDESW